MHHRVSAAARTTTELSANENTPRFRRSDLPHQRYRIALQRSLPVNRRTLSARATTALTQASLRSSFVNLFCLLRIYMMFVEVLIDESSQLIQNIQSQERKYKLTL